MGTGRESGFERRGNVSILTPEYPNASVAHPSYSKEEAKKRRN